MKMDAAIYDEPWKVELYELIQRAKVKRRWLFINSLATGPMWFSPRELEAEHRAGKFMWGVPNWKLRDPHEQLAAADERVRKATEERNLIVMALLKEAQPPP